MQGLRIGTLRKEKVAEPPVFPDGRKKSGLCGNHGPASLCVLSQLGYPGSNQE